MYVSLYSESNDHVPALYQINTGIPRPGFPSAGAWTQGLALDGDILYVADRKNHVVRSLNLKTLSTSTVAGNGQQNRDSRSRGGQAPWLPL